MKGVPVGGTDVTKVIGVPVAGVEVKGVPVGGTEVTGVPVGGTEVTYAAVVGTDVAAVTDGYGVSCYYHS